MASLDDLSRLVFDHAERDEVEEACGGYSKQHVLRFLLTNEPYSALVDLVGRRGRLQIIAEELGVERSKLGEVKKSKIVQMIFAQILPKGSDEPQLLGFFVLEKNLRLVNSLPPPERYDKVSRLVNDFEFLVKHLYRFYRGQIMPKETEEGSLKGPLISEKHTSLSKVINSMESVQRRSVSDTSLQEASKRLLQRKTVFPGIDFGELRDFAQLRNKTFGHRERYYVPSRAEITDTTEMMRKLSILCPMFQGVAPKAVIQVHYSQDSFGRHRVYYAEEERDFDAGGRPTSVVYKHEERLWQLNHCQYYCSAITIVGRYRPGGVAFLLPQADDEYPFIDPEIYDAHDLNRISMATIAIEPEE